MLLELKLLLILGAVSGLLFGINRFISNEQRKGYDQKAAEDQVITSQVQATFRAQEHAEQKRYDSVGAAYEKALHQVEDNNARAAAGRMRATLNTIAQSASAAASAPGATCKPQEQRIAAGATVLGEGVELVEQSRALVERLGLKVQALQDLCGR